LEEFLKQNYSLITHSVEFMAAVTGILLFKKYNKTAAKFFIAFLIYLLVCDIFAGYTWHVYNDGVFSFLKGTVFERNYWWTTLTWFIGAITFFTFYYNKILKTLLYRKLIKYVGVLFLLISLVYIAIHWEDYFVKYFVFINVFGALVILLCVTLYFIEILKSEQILTFYKSLNFYISAGILLWWLIITPLVFYNMYFSSADWDFVVLQDTIYILSNILMYSTFTFGLIYAKPEHV